MRILVTGGAGFIGSNYVHYLIENTDDTVVTLDALTYAGTKENLEAVIDHPRHEFVEGDIRDRTLVTELLEDIDAVVNFAAESHVDRSIQSSEPFVTTNVHGTQTLLDAAVEGNIERFLQISTDEVYGQVLDGTFNEDDPLDPRNPYAATKAGADLLALSYETTYDLPVLVTRSSNNYGPRQHPEKLIPKLVSRATAGQSLPIYGDGSNVREWTFVEDNCRAIHRVLQDGTPGEIYNIGSGVEIPNIEVARRVLDTVGASHDLIEFVEDRPGHDQRYALDIQKVSALGWEPQWSFDEGLERTIDHFV
ncbi:dTDP-glucose 4,6-dehydratase [Halococcus saccharolyticus]|uniref:dTDP-glucose 4,6-dehydratase n=1 Tax=Halococcus saccharolyticus DSM 5350 TaxID=1227455 RepID=M0MK45_9EURY|nr:dTDP-glucose 4,6-dehydratase [Halococcus saccharolyticus]EMA44825.1 dTDP-glucose 4,6-dehydratase [Halococcus saccharolyticus DSM 5350]